MPAFPEIINIIGKVWKIKIDFTFKAKQISYSQSYFRIACKVAINLYSVKKAAIHKAREG